MDNFIDRITNRFSGQEVIKANAEAEALEMRKLKTQAEQAQRTLAQYEALMQEMRKLNLRNTESAKIVAELIENAQIILKAVKNIELAEKKDNTEKIITSMSEKFADFSEQIAESHEKVEKIAAAAEKISNSDNALSETRELLEKGVETHTKIKEDLENTIHKENVKVYRNVQAALIEEIGRQNDNFKEELKSVKKLTKPILCLAILVLLAVLSNLGLNIAQLLGFL
ncbi:MAG: hypothetical protein FWG91_04410 [Lachnospiraceae bacterium]|nr:hypothetical protein [Lachnospiraceae bacterium]